jgi:hypothetical protein
LTDWRQHLSDIDKLEDKPNWFYPLNGIKRTMSIYRGERQNIEREISLSTRYDDKVIVVEKQARLIVLRNFFWEINRYLLT